MIYMLFTLMRGKKFRATTRPHARWGAMSVLLAGTLCCGGIALAQYNVIEAPSAASQEQVREQLNYGTDATEGQKSRWKIMEEVHKRRFEKYEAKVSRTDGTDLGLNEDLPADDSLASDGKDVGAVKWARDNWRGIFALSVLIGGCLMVLRKS